MDEPQVYFAEDAFVERSSFDGAMKQKAHQAGNWNGSRRAAKSNGVEIGCFTKLPRHLFGSGKAAKLGPSVLCLYVALCEHANRHGKNTFSASDDSLARDIGISPRTISNARKLLIEHRLVQGVLERGRACSYTLLPQAFEFKPVGQRPRAQRKPRAYRALTKDTGAAEFFAGAAKPP